MSISYVGRLKVGGQSYPLFSFRVPAGFPSPADDHLEQDISLDELFQLRAPHTYLITVGGDSLKDIGMFSGDIALVDRSRTVKSGKIVVAALNGEPCLKRYCVENKAIVLRSENPAYAPRYILESDELSIWGVVRYSIRDHDLEWE